MLSRILELATNLTMVHKAIIGVVLLVVLYFAYGWYQKRSQQAAGRQTEGMPDAQASGEVVCTMYHVDWCKFCQKAKPEWEQLESEFNGKVVNGKKVVIANVDCDKNEEIAEKENIKGYPTFKFSVNGKYVDYPDEPVFDKLKTFVEYLAGQA